MNTEVTLRATGVEVTASTEERATAYLKEDGAQFRRSWDYELDGCDRTDAEPDDPCHARLEVEVDEPAGRGERIWRGDVLFTLVIEGEPDDDAAFEEARTLLAA